MLDCEIIYIMYCGAATAPSASYNIVHCEPEKNVTSISFQITPSKINQFS